MKYYVYKTTNNINGNYYIGVHQSNNIERDKYLGSGYVLQIAINKYGKDNFSRELLFEFDTPEEAFKKEREIVNEEFLRLKETYNLVLGGHGGNIVGNHSEETKRIISELHKGRILTEEHKEKIRIGVLESEIYHEYIHSEENRNRISEMRTGQLHTEETKKIISEKATGRIHTDETRKKMSENSIVKGIPKSEEFKEHLSELFTGRNNDWNQITNKNPEKIRKTAEKHTGMKRSENTKKNISESKTGCVLGEKSSAFHGYWITPKGKYSSSIVSAKEYDIESWVIRERCKNNKRMISKELIIKYRDLSMDMLGKTWEELGWSFEQVIGEI